MIWFERINRLGRIKIHSLIFATHESRGSQLPRCAMVQVVRLANFEIFRICRRPALQDSFCPREYILLNTLDRADIWMIIFCDPRLMSDLIHTEH